MQSLRTKKVQSLFTSQAVACRSGGEALTVQAHANYGGASKFLRLWFLSLDSLHDKNSFFERILSDHIPNEKDLSALVREVKQIASSVPASVLISDRNFIYVVLSKEFSLTVVDTTKNKSRVFKSPGIISLRKGVASMPNNTILILGTNNHQSDIILSRARNSNYPSSSEKLGSLLEESLGDGPIAILSLKRTVNAGQGFQGLGVGDIESDRGLVKDSNEDSASILSVSYSSSTRNSKFRLISVADGVGGAAYGELASKIAVSVAPGRMVRELLSGASDDFPTMMNSAFQAANERLETVASYTNKSMASTLTISLIQATHLLTAHAGDTRAYEVNGRNRTIRRLTADHRLQQNGVTSHVITRAIGSPNYLPEVGATNSLEKNTILLTCTDGLHDLVSDEEILRMCHSSDTPRRLCTNLIRLANSRGGRDNITVAAYYR